MISRDIFDSVSCLLRPDSNIGQDYNINNIFGPKKVATVENKKYADLSGEIYFTIFRINKDYNLLSLAKIEMLSPKLHYKLVNN